MPFTPSHAVLALAFRSPMVPASAVAVGAMTPDLPLFVPGVPPYGVTHDPRWLPLTVLMAAVLWSVWRIVIAPAVPDLAPGPLAARVPAPTPFPRTAPRIVGAVAALVIGVVSHLVWDAFTHLAGWGTAHLPLLRERIGGQPVYSVLQELSSVLGLAGLGVWLFTRTRHPLDVARRQRVRWLRGSVIAAVVVAAVVGVAIGLSVTGPLWRQLMTVATTGGAVVGVVVGAGVAGWWLTIRWSSTRWSSTRRSSTAGRR